MGQSETDLIVEPRPVKLTMIQKIRQVSCGRAHSLLISEHGQVFAVGDNADGQLGMSPRDSVKVHTPHLV